MRLNRRIPGLDRARFTIRAILYLKQKRWMIIWALAKETGKAKAWAGNQNMQHHRGLFSSIHSRENKVFEGNKHFSYFQSSFHLRHGKARWLALRRNTRRKDPDEIFPRVYKICSAFRSVCSHHEPLIRLIRGRVPFHCRQYPKKQRRGMCSSREPPTPGPDQPRTPRFQQRGLDNKRHIVDHRPKERKKIALCIRCQSNCLHLHIHHLLEQTAVFTSDQFLQHSHSITQPLDLVLHVPHFHFGLVDIVHGFRQDVALAHFARRDGVWCFGHVAVALFTRSGPVM